MKTITTIFTTIFAWSFSQRMIFFGCMTVLVLILYFSYKLTMWVYKGLSNSDELGNTKIQPHISVLIVWVILITLYFWKWVPLLLKYRLQVIYLGTALVGGGLTFAGIKAYMKLSGKRKIFAYIVIGIVSIIDIALFFNIFKLFT